MPNETEEPRDLSHLQEGRRRAAAKRKQNEIASLEAKMSEAIRLYEQHTESVRKTRDQAQMLASFNKADRAMNAYFSAKRALDRLNRS